LHFNVVGENVPRGTSIASVGEGFGKKLWFKMWFLDGLGMVFLWFWRTTDLAGGIDVTLGGFVRVRANTEILRGAQDEGLPVCSG
jgi:hypothetical protein